MIERPAPRPRVLMGSPRPRSDGNPYLLELTRGLGDGADVRFFSWRNGLLWRYDLLHLHWPETLFRGATRTRTVLKTVLGLVLVVRLVLRRTPVVQTVHNHRPHEASGLVETFALSLLARRVCAEVHLVPARGTDPQQRLTRVVPHGHYRGAYRRIDPLVRPTGEVLFVGSVREYKGVVPLVRAFTELPDPGLTLRVAGAPSDEGLRRDVEREARGDDRIVLELERLSAHRLEEVIEDATLVCLPFTEFLNSGTALLALSLGRPVLMPASTSADLLREECGPSWVLTFSGDLTPRHLEEAYRQVALDVPLDLPTLEGRDWDEVALRHAELYEAVLR